MVDNSEQSVVCTGAQLASAAEFLLQGYILLEAGTWSLQTREYFHTLHMRNMHFLKEEGHGSVMAVSRACLCWNGEPILRHREDACYTKGQNLDLPICLDKSEL